ncbi:unnamed protein product [Soboliphyme baturini]|uniref:HMA domain-containing protein n=1 Tax=Soboliphyme baturini TaxID=241478 RepID=A0A183JB14_9BILA|nr:unnamed protein product [Soboliphyme baturini]
MDPNSTAATVVKKLRTGRVLPRVISTVNVDLQSRSLCNNCVEVLKDAVAKGLPQSIKNSKRRLSITADHDVLGHSVQVVVFFPALLKGEAIEKTIMAYLMRSRPMKVIRWLLFPSLLSFHITYVAMQKLVLFFAL